MTTPTNPDIVSDLSALIDVADPLDLELRPPAGGNKWSADLMTKSASRPAVGVQGRILDAMDDEKITRRQASMLLDQVHAILRGGRPGISIVDDGGNLHPISMEVVNGTSP
jgi:hypothetical protein